MGRVIWFSGCLALVVALGSAARADEPAGCPALCQGGCAKCASACDAKCAAACDTKCAAACDTKCAAACDAKCATACDGKCAAKCSADCCTGEAEEVADDDASLSVSATLWIAHQLLP